MACNVLWDSGCPGGGSAPVRLAQGGCSCGVGGAAAEQGDRLPRIVDALLNGDGVR